MKISIGMLAWNEEERIAQAIQSLFQQSVFSLRWNELSVDDWELIVVPNGCTDNTKKVASDALARCMASLQGKNVSVSVVDVAEPGKSNAWNRYIHDFSRQDADLVIMVDSDIEFDHPDTVFNSVKLLVDVPGCVVAVDKPLKDFIKKVRRSLIEKLSLHFSNERFERDPGIAGSFYCARGPAIRNIWMPKGLPGEDGFLKSMLVTDCFRSEVDLSRIARAENASHFYEGLSGPRAIFNHELRMVIGTALNCYFTWDFLKFATDPRGPGAGQLIRNWLENDPNWYRKFIANEIRNRGWWVLPRGLVFRRLTRLRGIAFHHLIKRLPLALIAFLFDLLVCFAANRRLKNGKAIGYW